MSNESIGADPFVVEVRGRRSVAEVPISYSIVNDAPSRISYVYLDTHPWHYHRYEEDPVARTEDMGHGLSLDFDASGRVIGIEHLWPPDEDE